MNVFSYFLILFSLTTLLISINAKSSQSNMISRRHPEDKCGGTRMFYTPLVRQRDEEELGVCDSSCSSIPSSGAQRRMHKMLARKRNAKTNLQASTSNDSTTSSNMYTCNNTKTWPEEGIPENVKDNFPFYMQTCFFDQIDTIEAELIAQNTFEKACKDANGVFVRPLHRTW